MIEGAIDDISELESRVDIAEGDINSLRLDVDGNASDIESLQSDISNISDVLEGIELEHTSDLLYTLKVNGISAGTINIPEDQFLSQVSYNQNTKILTFTFEDGTHTDINISDLVDEYNAGDGISIANHRVNVAIDSASEKGLNASGSGFLSVGPSGLAIHGIIDEIDRAYVAGPGLQRSNVRNSENEWVLSAKIEQNSADILHATNDGLGVNIQAIGSKLDFSALAGNHLAYNPSTKKLEVDVASLVADPTFVSAVTNIVVTNPAFTNAINDAVEASNGNVVVIEKGSKLTYDVTHKARLIDTEQYSVTGYEAFFGFLSGLCAGNYDVTDVLVDSTFKIGGQNIDEFAVFIEKINTLAAKTDTQFTFLVSADESELPETLAAVAEKV